MEMDFIRDRITELRMKRDISEYRLSYEAGHSKNYIHNIVSGHSQPSIKELLYIIECLGVTPRDFFDEDQEYRNPILVKEILTLLRDMSDDSLKAAIEVIRRFK